jgi:hypothetical protein
MAEKIIGSLIYGEHVPPAKQRPWKDRLKVPCAIGIVLLLIGVTAYKFANYREERLVTTFLDEVWQGHYDQAFANWDAQGSYTMKDFLDDWGKDGYYTKGSQSFSIEDSNSSGTVVVVYVGLDNFDGPVALRVDKETLKMSFSPINKYRQ